MTAQLLRLGHDFGELLIPWATHDFAYRMPLRSGDNTGTGGVPFVYSMPADCRGLAISERSENRGVVFRTGRSASWQPLIEGTPVACDIRKGEPLYLDRLDLTCGLTAIRCLFGTKSVGRALFDSLPVLIRDYTSADIFHSAVEDLVANFPYFLFQAPRIRGVRHRAGVIWGDTAATTVTTNLAGYFRNAGYVHPGSTLGTALDDWFSVVYAPWTMTGGAITATPGALLEACDADVIAFNLDTLTGTGALRMRCGFIAPA